MSLFDGRYVILNSTRAPSSPSPYEVIVGSCPTFCAKAIATCSRREAIFQAGCRRFPYSGESLRDLAMLLEKSDVSLASAQDFRGTSGVLPSDRPGERDTPVGSPAYAGDPDAEDPVQPLPVEWGRNGALDPGIGASDYARGSRKAPPCPGNHRPAAP